MNIHIFHCWHATSTEEKREGYFCKRIKRLFVEEICCWCNKTRWKRYHYWF